MSDSPRVLAILTKEAESCLLWRHWWPSEAVRAHGYVADYVNFEGNFNTSIMPMLKSGDYNIVVTPRICFNEPWMTDYFAMTLRRHNITWVFEADDDLFSPYIVQRNVDYGMPLADNQAYEPVEREIRLRSLAEDHRQERIRMLKMVDGVTVSTPTLAEVVKEYTRAPVHVVPNTINTEWFAERINRRGRSIPPISIGWSGGWRSEADLEPLIPAWINIGKRFPETRFVLHGWAPQKLFQALLLNFPTQRYRILPWTELDGYPSALKNIDIGCCTVADTRWNACKSTIKWYEMSLAGTACIGSHALYGREITDGYDGLLASTSDEWEISLARLVADAGLRHDLQQHAVGTVRRDHAIDTGWRAWIDAWRAVLDTTRVRRTARGAVSLAGAQ